MARRPRHRTGDPELDAAVEELVARVGSPNDDLVFELVATALRFARDQADRGEMKIAAAALRELRFASKTFAPYRSERKVAIFGSARTQIDDPLYEQARGVAEALADRDWMVITGAGPGIMEAGLEGAGAERSFGVSIQLPFEGTTSQFMADDPKLLNFRYFFTRKLEFVKESHGFVLLPGGFGTLDEAFELLTLVQTGKTVPAPIVLLDVPGGTYWSAWRRFVADELGARGYIGRDDLDLLTVTDDPAIVVDEITGFYANYHSLRYVSGRLVLRMRTAPDDDELARLSDEFADILVEGRIERVDTTPAERADDDHVDLDRVALRFDRYGHARLRALIDRLNHRDRV